MGRRRLETPAKNVRKKTTEGVGCESPWRKETGNARFLDANTLHMVAMVSFECTGDRSNAGRQFETFWTGGPAAAAAEAGFAISGRVGWPHATALLRG